MRKGWIVGVAGLAAVLFSTSAMAGGYDTPMLYSARHMGMGGVAIAFVDDPSALFHNPAGLARATRWSVLGDFSPLIGSVRGSPANNPAAGEPINLESETTFAPFFFLGLSYQPLSWLAIGLAAYPVASAGGEYIYENAGGTTVTDYTKLFFLEITPGIAFSLPARITLGINYRIVMASLVRTQTPEGADPTLDMDLSGWSFTGFRVGGQWEAIRDHLSIGITYRHVTRTETTADEITVPPALGGTLYNASSEFTLPSQLGFGVRGDLFNFGLAVDLVIGFNSQNDATVIAGNLEEGNNETRQELANIFEWSNAVTLRVGAEYDIHLSSRDDRHILTPRLGYVYDGKTTNEEYVTAFGTPPTATHVLTLGLGYDFGSWEMNLAYAYRFGSVTVTYDPADRERSCAFCSYPGDYAIGLHGVYFDISMDLGPRGHNPWDARRESEAEQEPDAPEAQPEAPEDAGSVDATPAGSEGVDAAPADQGSTDDAPAEGTAPESDAGSSDAGDAPTDEEMPLEAI
jgi:long-chain fatty acid transport protein